MQPNGTKSDRAYDAIGAMITFQELAPGEMLSEAILMKLTGFGRTPVREALQRLARQGMVEIHPSRGVFVAPISVEAQLKMLELRRTLENLAVRLATHRARTDQKNAMLGLVDDLEQVDKSDVRDFEVLLKRDHEIIAAATDNDYLRVALAPLQGLSRRFWFAHIDHPEAELTQATQLHTEILRAICHGDESEAGEASQRLNDYLIEFTYQTLHPKP